MSKHESTGLMLPKGFELDGPYRERGSLHDTWFISTNVAAHIATTVGRFPTQSEITMAVINMTQIKPDWSE